MHGYISACIPDVINSVQHDSHTDCMCTTKELNEIDGLFEVRLRGDQSLSFIALLRENKGREIAVMSIGRLIKSYTRRDRIKTLNKGG